MHHFMWNFSNNCLPLPRPFGIFWKIPIVVSWGIHDKKPCNWPSSLSINYTRWRIGTPTCFGSIFIWNINNKVISFNCSGLMSSRNIKHSTLSFSFKFSKGFFLRHFESTFDLGQRSRHSFIHDQILDIFIVKVEIGKISKNSNWLPSTIWGSLIIKFIFLRKFIRNWRRIICLFK